MSDGISHGHKQYSEADMAHGRDTRQPQKEEKLTNGYRRTIAGVVAAEPDARRLEFGEQGDGWREPAGIAVADEERVETTRVPSPAQQELINVPNLPQEPVLTSGTFAAEGNCSEEYLATGRMKTPADHGYPSDHLDDWQTGRSGYPVIHAALKAREQHLFEWMGRRLADHGLKLEAGEYDMVIVPADPGPEIDCGTFKVNVGAPDPLGLKQKGRDLGRLLAEKNAAYGSAFAKAGEFLKILYPDGIGPDQYAQMLVLIRIFDKQMRIATDKDALGEDPFQDIAGYGLLGTTL